MIVYSVCNKDQTVSFQSLIYIYIFTKTFISNKHPRSKLQKEEFQKQTTTAHNRKLTLRPQKSTTQADKRATMHKMQTP